MNKIDFVIAWVDGNDDKWKKDFMKHKNSIGEKEISRFRDWDNLQYMFRAFETFTPWVHKIYFITYGHLPQWLNINHPKLVIVNHQDYMQEKNLPVFNSHPIEINMHRIKGLSEKFVYFNDDMFILKPLKETIFFRKNLPVNTALLNVMHTGAIAHIMVNNIDIINKHSYKQKLKIIFSHPFKWFYPKYGLKVIRTIVLLLWSKFTGFKHYHHPQPFLKTTFEGLWEKETTLLEKVSASKFRKSSDINQYLFRYWQFITNNFYPDSVRNSAKLRKHISIVDDTSVDIITKDIAKHKYQMYCINDELEDENNFEVYRDSINKALNSILPKKSEFEI